MSRPSLVTLHAPNPFVPLPARTGKLTFTLTNDYLFKVILQRNEIILRALLCSLLGLRPKAIRSIVIANPIEPGNTIDDKDALLDIKLILNNRQILNLEMQIKNEHNWPERSLTYLCRNFDNVRKGQDYITVTPVRHIGILNFSLPDVPKQFYSHYYLMDNRTHSIFTDKFRLSVLDLTQTALATEHDRRFHLDRWAAAFKATTWEEFNMLAKEDILFKKVADALYLLAENPEIAEQVRRRDEAAAREKRKEAERKRLEAERKRLETKQKRTEAERKRLAAEQKRTETERNQLEAKQKRTEAERNQLAQENEKKDAEINALRAKLAQFEANRDGN